MKFKFISLFTLLLFLNVSTAALAYSVIPSGEAVGVTVKTDGLLVTDISEVIDENGRSVNTAYNAGVRKGDRITAVDGNILLSNEELAEYVSERPNKIVLTIKRDNKTLNLLIQPIKTSKGYKLGLWVRDSTAGIGTITYIDPVTCKFAGLGHGISDIDTNDILTIREGNILKCNLTPATKGKRGVPGELNGVFTNNSLGKISVNSPHGIFGEYTNVNTGKCMEIANSQEILAGKAYILADIDGKGVAQYNILIKKIFPKDTNGKNLVIEVTDQSLIGKTGGIVQGMSGSPIIQNGKLIGAVTHVLVNDPTKGYGIFIKNMISSAE